MTLDNYIKDLLYRYDCVIVPNFGGFVTNRIGASVNHYTHTFYPPTKQVSFNKHLQHNDGLLVNYLAKVDNISFDKAYEKVADVVKEWNNQLQESNLEISQVGTLSLNSENQLEFEPNLEVNLLTSSYGLSPFESSAIQRIKEQATPVIPIVNTEEKKRSLMVPMFAKYAASAAVLLMLGFAGLNVYQKDQQQKIFAKQQEKLDKKIQEATFVIDNPLPTINLTVAKAAPEKYHIIAGAFEFPENANKKVKQLQNKGFDAKIIGKNKWGLTQVTFKSLSNKEDALKELRKIKFSESNDAWLLVKTLQ